MPAGADRASSSAIGRRWASSATPMSSASTPAASGAAASRRCASMCRAPQPVQVPCDAGASSMTVCRAIMRHESRRRSICAPGSISTAHCSSRRWATSCCSRTANSSSWRWAARTPARISTTIPARSSFIQLEGDIVLQTIQDGPDRRRADPRGRGVSAARGGAALAAARPGHRRHRGRAAPRRRGAGRIFLVLRELRPSAVSRARCRPRHRDAAAGRFSALLLEHRAPHLRGVRHRDGHRREPPERSGAG